MTLKDLEHETTDELLARHVRADAWLQGAVQMRRDFLAVIRRHLAGVVSDQKGMSHAEVTRLLNGLQSMPWPQNPYLHPFPSRDGGGGKPSDLSPSASQTPSPEAAKTSREEEGAR